MSESNNAAQVTPNAATTDSGQATPKVEMDAIAKADVAMGTVGKKPEAENSNSDANKTVEANKEVKYDLKMPEGSPLGSDAIEKIVSLSKERGLSNEQAQAVLERESEAVSSFAANQKEQYEQRASAWVDEVKNDKEIGGEKFNENIAHAQRVLKRFGNDALTKVLNETGLGNYPELVRFCTKIGKAMSEDKLVGAGSNTGGSQSMEELFYGQPKGE